MSRISVVVVVVVVVVANIVRSKLKALKAFRGDARLRKKLTPLPPEKENLIRALLLQNIRFNLREKKQILGERRGTLSGPQTKPSDTSASIREK